MTFRGLSNPTYYWLNPTDPSNYYDYSGTGNTLDAGEPEVLRLILCSLRYWASEMHVDGFRFDLAAVLARQEGNLEKFAAFLDLVYQDPVISQVKLLAEPWDANGGYVLGQFPPPWAQWNDHYRANIRDFWRAQAGIGDLATRLAGSHDVFAAPDQSPESSVNVVTCHDGFTLTDLVSYNAKHNEANGNNNSDGSDDNRSWNCGDEGPSTDADIVALRAQQRRNFLSTLLISQGVPMILGGDEIGRTQGGNNNAYCQDNPINYYDWNLDQERRDLLAFTSFGIGLRREHPVFRRRSFLTGQQPRTGSGDDVVWLWTDGTPMTSDRWNSGSLAFAMWLNGAALTDTDANGERPHRRYVPGLVQRLLELTALHPAAGQPRYHMDAGTRHHPVDRAAGAVVNRAARRLGAHLEPTQPAGAAQNTMTIWGRRPLFHGGNTGNRWWTTRMYLPGRTPNNPGVFRARMADRTLSLAVHARYDSTDTSNRKRHKHCDQRISTQEEKEDSNGSGSTTNQSTVGHTHHEGRSRGRRGRDHRPAGVDPRYVQRGRAP